MKWIKCSEQKPEDREEVLFYPKRYDFWLYGIFRDDDTFICIEEGPWEDYHFHPSEVSYWTEVTEPPNEVD